VETSGTKTIAVAVQEQWIVGGIASTVLTAVPISATLVEHVVVIVEN